MSNPGYDELQIAFSPSHASTPQKHIAQGREATPQASANGRRPSSASQRKGRLSTASERSGKAVNNYDLVEGGPGTVCPDSATDNPNYEMKIPVAGNQRSVPDSVIQVTVESSYQNASMSEYRNLPDGHMQVPPRTDDSGYLVACMNGPTSFIPARSPFSDCSRSTAMTSVAVSPNDDGSGVFKFPPVAMISQPGPLPPSVHSAVSPSGVDKSSAAAGTDRHRKDSGIEVEDSGPCYAVVPITDASFPVASHLAPSQHYIRGQSSGEQVKNMSPIPEQASNCSLFAKSPGQAGSERLAQPVEHQYAFINEIAPGPKSPSATSQQQVDADDSHLHIQCHAV